MNGKKDKKIGQIRKRLSAGILAVLMVCASIQFPAGSVYAEEMTAAMNETAGSMEELAAERSREEENLTRTDAGDKSGSDEKISDGEKEEPGEGKSGAETAEGVSGDGADGEGSAGEAAGNGTGSEEIPGDASEDRTDGEETSGGRTDDGETPGEAAGNGTDGGEKPEEDSKEGGTSNSGETDGEEASEGTDDDGTSVSDNGLPEGDPFGIMEEETGSGIVALAESEGPLNLANLSEEYTALDGSTISSAAQGRPKLLIFYSNTCGNCRGTITNISRAIADFAGVDIYAIETNGKKAEEVAGFQRQYGCDEIVFSYDTGVINQNSMWRYVRAGGLDESESITWPVICYIDADNLLQYVTTAYKTSDEVLSGLKDYCGHTDAEKYQITYILCGGTNHKANPAVFTSAMDTVILQDPSRAGQQFDGWYKEPEYSNRVTQIPKGTASDITLYAKWSPLSASGQPEINMTPAEGNIVMGFSGSYYTESADKILKRLNAIRLEACKQGVRNPATGQPLTLADYVPVYWSSDLEAIARLRAAEATVSQAHTRPNGKICFTATTDNNIGTSAENLAWNYSGMMEGIEQWYGEKNDWVNKTGKETGHYESLIRPELRAVGLGAFRLTSGGWYAVAQEFSFEDTLDAYKNPGKGNCVQYMEVQGSNVSALKFSGSQATFIREGNTHQLSLRVTAKYKDYGGAEKSFSGPYQAGGKWDSSNEEAAVADSTGRVSAKAKGKTRISVTAGTKSDSIDITVYGRDESPILIQSPARTTYTVGQKLDVTGGTVTYPSNGTEVTKELTSAMLSGFDSSKPGICPVTVVCGGYAASFDTLIADEPELEQKAVYGQKLGDIPLPSNEYGVYSWQDGTQVLREVGTHSFAAEYTPNDEERFQKLTDLQIEVTTQRTLGNEFEIAFKDNRFTYNGTAQEPKVVVTASDSDTLASGERVILLAEGRDYTLSYQNNRNAGTATVIVEGAGSYNGRITGTFEIEPARLVIRAKDRTILVDGGIPGANEYEYEISGLMPGDSLVSEPVFSCDISDTKATGRYSVIPHDADAGMNYTIFYENGRLTVSRESVSCTVTFDVQGHGTAPAEQVGMKAGDMIERPEDPSADGYRFDGWYKDTVCTKAWNFDEDIVQADITLYAGWLHESAASGFAMQEIADVYYTGKVCRPAVSVYDGDTLLKAGKDYQIRYYNNINANKDGKLKQGNGEGVYFDPELPYAEITGRKNYTDQIKVNFNILRVPVGDDNNKPAAGVVVKISEQLTTADRVQKPFSSIKCGRAMKVNTDYTLRLTVVNARGQSGRSLTKGLALENAAIPAGYEGIFELTVQGQGNYEGSIRRTIYVADKQHLMRNTRVTLGANQKNIVFNGRAVQLTPSESDSPDTFTVKSGSQILRYMKDYKIKEYHNNEKVGKAEMVLAGIGEYSGEKIVTFHIRGRDLTKRTVEISGIEDKVYTGRALTQNGAVLTYGKGTTEERTLQYGEDYTISYEKNINKGTATMTFKGREKGGFTGSVKAAFKITAADIALTDRAPEMQNITIRYSKTGAKPVEEIVLTNKEGVRLVNGKDYTLRYTNNKNVAGKTAETPPAVIVKGRGNYAGEFPVYFNIVKGNLRGDTIKVSVSAMPYQRNKAADHAYKPSVKVTDGKSGLRAGVDYEITYENNTQADYERYIQYLDENASVSGGIGTGQGADIPPAPRVVITGKAEGNYTISSGGPISAILPIYRTRLTKTNLNVKIEESVYTGKQLTPAVTVYYQGENGEILLTEGKDYSLSYGTNVISGRNKGSVTISGIGPYYGGNVTVKFDIEKKRITY